MLPYTKTTPTTLPEQMMVSFLLYRKLELQNYNLVNSIIVCKIIITKLLYYKVTETFSFPYAWGAI